MDWVDAVSKLIGLIAIVASGFASAVAILVKREVKRLAVETSSQAATEQIVEMQKKIDAYRKNVARYESEPSTQEGKKELLVRAKAAEELRDHALKQDPYFDYAEVLLQIAIVLASVAIVSGISWLVIGSAALGIAGTLLMINGFLLIVSIPGLG